MSDIGQRVYEVASEYLGLQEYPGARHNETIIKMFADTGNSWVKDDETPWCAAFVGSILAQCGLRGTGRLNARSYLDWGVEVPLSEAEKGDVVVLWRGSRNGAQGHVGFFSSEAPDGRIVLLGGNQGNKVSIAPFGRERVLGVRRLPPPTPERTSPAQSTTVQASTVQIAAGAGGAITAAAALDGTAQVVLIAVGAIVIVAGLWVMRERLRKWSRGER